MSPAAALFLTVLAVELLLLGLVVWNRRGVSSAARVLIFLAPLLLALSLRTALAYCTRAVLDWDETYYMSLAVTGAAGRGLYPYIYGFGPMHIMGGMGYATYSYALAVKLFGPTIFALRTVSLLASVLGLAGIWTLVKNWYGSAPAWLAAALTASLHLFVLSNSARMDSWTFAYVAWALVVFAAAVDRWHTVRWHLFAGFIFGLGLQFHIDTVATAMAVGIVYLIRYAGDAHRARRVLLSAHPMFLYVAGFSLAVITYICLNILPDRAAYYVTTVLVRVDATGTYSTGTSSIAGSFLNPHILLAKEAIRYRQVLAMTPVLELALVAGGIVAMAVRRNAADRIALVLVPGVLAAAAILLNNASPLYFIHVAPALIVPMAPLLTHGFTPRMKVTLADLTPWRLLTCAAVLSAVCAVSGAATVRRVQAVHDEAPPEIVQHFRTFVDRQCSVAADGGWYVPYLADYPFYVSLRQTEVKHGMLYYGTGDEAAYWQLTQPDVIADTSAPRPGLAAYIESQHLVQAAPGLWMRAGGCANRGAAGKTENRR